MSAGEEGGPGGSADCAGRVELGEDLALRRQLVNVRRPGHVTRVSWGDRHVTSPVGGVASVAEVAIPKVIHEENDNVWSPYIAAVCLNSLNVEAD